MLSLKFYHNERNGSFKIALYNHGMGPTTLKDVKYFFKDIEYSNLYELILKCNIPVRLEKTKYAKLSDGYIIAEKDKVTFIEGLVKTNEPNYLLKFFAYFSDVSIKLTYTDLYSNEFPFDGELIP